MNADFPSFLVSVTASLLALLIDLRFGEPPARWHPVVWMGHYLQWLTPWVAPPASAARSLPSPSTEAAVAEADAHPSANRCSRDEQHVICDAAAKGTGSDPSHAGTPGGLEAVAGPTPATSGPRSGQHSSCKAFLRGTVAWLCGALMVGALAWCVQQLILTLAVWMAAPLMALCLKPMLSWRMLRDEVQAVEDALSVSLDAGRERLRWLVSRDVSVLDEAGVRESAIETLAENLNDSVVAPLFWFAVSGLPGAALYRFANTADAMWGYPGERSGRHWQWAGKWAARADDVLNWIPARLTAALLMMTATSLPVPAERRAGQEATDFVQSVARTRDDNSVHVAHTACGTDDMASQGKPERPAGNTPSARRWRVLCREAARTPSPNSGWPMSAMALRLGVSLGKPGVYRLNDGAPPPSATHTLFALGHAARVAWLSGILGMLAAGVAALA